MVIDMEEPYAPAGGTAAASSAPEPAVAPQAVSGSAQREAARQKPAPLEISAEGKPPRAVKVPVGPTDKEKEEHYLTHVLFRAWCSY